MSGNSVSRSRSGFVEEPKAKRARKIVEADLGGPIEDEETAKQKLANAGFDPNNIALEKMVESPERDGTEWSVSPTIHFCAAGDLKMIRYLVSKGIPTVRVRADDDDEDEEVLSPMDAALIMGQVHVCKWLFEHGAREEVENDAYNVGGNDHLLQTALWPYPAGRGSDTPQWLILNGALSSHDGTPNKEAIEAIETLGGPISQFRMLLSWAEDSFQTQTNVHLILLGSLLPKEYSVPALHQYLSERIKSIAAADFMISELSADKCKELWGKLPFSFRSSPLQMLCGESGIFETIADFAGFLRGTQITDTLRGIIGPLEKVLRRAEQSSPHGHDDNDGIVFPI